MAEENYFQWPDYLVLVIMLALSAAIGFYYACTGGKQRTTEEYLLADRNMHWFPVGCSLLASFVSSQTLIGLPGEVYTFGTIIFYGYIFNCLAVIGATIFYLPVMKRVRGISVYVYIEERFGKPLKYVMEVSIIFNMLFYATLATYGPALSISAVTGINIWLAVLSVALVAILYTVLGGIKAVLWTDTVQLVVMVTGIMLVLIMGTANEGGFSRVWDINKLSGRLDMLVPAKLLNFDPRMRHTIWWFALNSITTYVNSYGLQQASIQRALTLRSSRDVALAYGMTAAGTSAFGITCGLIGLLIFARYSLCDPITNGSIFSKDQLYPLYVLDLLKHLPGLPGIILASLLSASLSTISTLLNASSALVLEDFVRPFRPNLQEKQAVVISRVIVLALGFLTIVLVLFTRYFGSGLLSMGYTLSGIAGGPTFAVFTLGIFIPAVNHRGALTGFLCGSAMGAWIGFGALTQKPYIYHYPTTTVGCNITDVSNLTSPVYDPSTWDPQSHYRHGVAAMFDVSYLLVGPIGALITITVALIATIFPGERRNHISQRLLSPMLLKSCCLMPKSWRNKIIFDENDINENLAEGETILGKE